MPLVSFLDRLKERKLVQWAVAYLAGAWVVMQLIEVLSDRWPLPLGLQRGIDLLLVVGFFVTLVLAWYHGEKGQQRVTGPELLTLGALLLIAGLLLMLLRPDADPGVAESDAQRAATQAGATQTDGRSTVAVLPLTNLSQDDAEDYFVEGMHEAIITDLSKIGSLRVISRTSMMRYRDTELGIPEIARELSADAVVESSLFRAGDSVRITARLIDAETDENVWTATFDRELTDVLRLTGEVARSVAGEFAIALTPREEALLVSPSPVDPAAYETYLRGRFALDNFRFNEALEHYGGALALDSTFALAQAGLAGVHYLRGFFGQVPYEDAVSRAREAVTRAFELDDDAGEAHTALGYIRLYYDWDWPEAERSFLRALELNPNDAFARHGYADLLTVAGRAEDGVAQAELGARSDPFSFLVNATVVGHLFFARRYEDVLVASRDLQERFSRPAAGRFFQGLALWQLERYDEALAVLGGGWPDDASFKDSVRTAGEQDGPRGAMKVVADRLADSERSEPSNLALYYTMAGDYNAAFEWLEAAFEARVPGLLHATANPALAPLYADPRFDDLKRRIGLPAVLSSD
jgi:TolB-like protein